MFTSAELFFDPICPFCWMTSRWLEDVRSQRDLQVRYRPISLRMLNPDGDPDAPLAGTQRRGLELLRVVVAATENHGDEVAGPLYTAVGTAIHEQPVDGADGQDLEGVLRTQAARPADLPRVLREVGLPEELATATDDDRYDDAIRTSTEVARDRAGEDVGTPVITLGPPDGPSFFGPILSERPTGDGAVELFDAVATLAAHRPFTELKRSLRELPHNGALAHVS